MYLTSSDRRHGLVVWVAISAKAENTFSIPRLESMVEASSICFPSQSTLYTKQRPFWFTHCNVYLGGFSLSLVLREHCKNPITVGRVPVQSPSCKSSVSSRLSQPLISVQCDQKRVELFGGDTESGLTVV
ncbi:hypothetical protein Pelo_14337 [Pelomyxa schiedti]|nr:hypothetical protein Pelo_14337 [Pelomyxa schiedti]